MHVHLLTARPQLCSTVQNVSVPLKSTTDDKFYNHPWQMLQRWGRKSPVTGCVFTRVAQALWEKTTRSFRSC